MNRWLFGLILGMGALLALSGAEILRLRQERDAKPAIEQARESHSEKGPVKITKKERLIQQPDGKPPIKETETVTEIASQVKDTSSVLKETPAFVLENKPVRSWVYASTSPLEYKAVEVGGGLIFRETLGVGAGFNFYGRAEERVRLIVQVFFK